MPLIRQQRTPRLRSVVGTGTPVTENNIYWTPIELSDASVVCRLSGALSGMVLNGVPKFRIKETGDQAEAIDIVDDEMTVFFASNLPPIASLYLQLDDLAVRNEFGGKLVAGLQALQGTGPEPLPVPLEFNNQSGSTLTMQTVEPSEGLCVNVAAGFTNQMTLEIGVASAGVFNTVSVSFPNFGLSMGDIIVWPDKGPGMITRSGKPISEGTYTIP